MEWLVCLGIVFLSLLCVGVLIGLIYFICWICAGVVIAQDNKRRLDELCESYAELSGEVGVLCYRLCNLKKEVVKCERSIKNG